MDVVLDVSAVPLSEEQIQLILEQQLAKTKEDFDGEERKNVAIVTSIAFGQEGRFILPGNTDDYKEYKSAQEMIQDQVPLPDPIFMPGDVVPCTYDIGAQLNCLEKHEDGFKKMIQEMFESGPELKLTKEGMEELLEQR
jgi:hypothetical protein